MSVTTSRREERPACDRPTTASEGAWPPMGDLPALWGGAWEQRAEMQRSWQAYYATCRHIGGEKPCRVKLQLRGAVGAASSALGGASSVYWLGSLAICAFYKSVQQSVCTLLVVLAFKKQWPALKLIVAVRRDDIVESTCCIWPARSAAYGDTS